MTTKYLLPCQCGNKIEVDSGQSGLKARCTCGADVPVPTLRHLASLDRVQETTSRATKPEWDLRHALVSIGIAIALLMVLPGIFLWFTLPPQPKLKPAFGELIRSSFAQMTAEQAWEEWQVLREGLKDETEIPEMQIYYSILRQHRRWTWLVGGVATAGLLLAGVAFVIRPRQSRPSAR